MSESTAVRRPPEPDFETVTTEELIAYRTAENEWRKTGAARAFTGEPDPGAEIKWRHVALPGRDVPVRVYRPAPADGGETALPLVVHVHGGGLVGTAVQCDWTNSRVATRLPALVVSVEHRLIAPDSPFTNAADDGWDVLRHVLGNAAEWGADPARAAVFGESCGALISALTAVRARDAGVELKAQVLVNPAVDVSETMLDYPSVTEFAYSPSRALPLLKYLQRIAVPPETDARAISPIRTGDLSGLAPALLVVPTNDALADHGRGYAERLRKAGTSVRLTEYPGAPHAFLTLPGVQPQAEAAQAEIIEFLRDALAG